MGQVEEDQYNEIPIRGRIPRPDNPEQIVLAGATIVGMSKEEED